MHRHSYVGRKFGRERDQRKALLKGLATSLVEHGKIETTYPKAKELIRYIEKVITKAKKGTLQGRRQVIAALSTQAAAMKLVDEIVPQISGRNSGHVRVERTKIRVGDGTQMATIAFVDELTSTPVASPAIKSAPKAPETSKKTTVKKVKATA